MDSAPTTVTPTVETPSGTGPVADAEPVLTDLLVEDVSIDGMCGVY